MIRTIAAWVPLAVTLLVLQPGTEARGGSPEDGRVALVAADDHWERLAATPGDGAADEIAVRTRRTADGEAIQAEVSLGLPIDHEVVWAVLTDYENMPRYVPGIRSTRVIDSAPGKKRVEIEGVARFLFIEFPISTTVDAAYHPPGSITIDSVAGNLAVRGIVRVLAEGGYTRVDYRVRIAPDFWLPPLIGNFLIGRLIRRQFEGMVAEMHRRADGHQTRGPAAPGGGRFIPARHHEEAQRGGTH